MSVVAKLQTSKAHRSPARDRLASLINQTTGLHRVARQAETMVERAQSLRDQAAERLKAASVAASRAREGHASAMLHSARTGEAVATAATTRELRHAESDAQDDVDAAQAALEVAEAERNEAVEARERAAREIARARDAVLVESFQPYLDDVRAGLEDLVRRCAPLKFIGAISDLPREQGVRARVLTENILLTFQRSFDRYPEVPIPVWEAAAKALLSDPDSPLPDVAPMGGS